MSWVCSLFSVSQVNGHLFYNFKLEESQGTLVVPFQLEGRKAYSPVV